MIVVSADEIAATYFEGYPDEFNQDIVRVLASAYKSAYDECFKKYQKPEAYYSFPHTRKTDIDAEITTLVQSRYPEIKVTAEENKRKTGFYRLFESRGVLLTIHRVQHPSSPVRPAVYRDIFASSSQVSFQFEEADAQEVQSTHEHKVYAQLKHGSEGKILERPSFARIVFPCKDGKVKLPPIDLFARYSKLINSLWVVSEETVKDTLEGFGLKTGVKETAAKEREKEKKDITG